MNTPVSFELSKLLKEKGFDIPQLYFYIDGDISWKVDNTRCRNQIEGEYAAPTIAEVVMWLYDEYGVWIVVNVNIMGSWYFEHFDLKEKRNAQFKPTDTHYDSPTEAYEAAIEYTLKNLI